MEQHMTKLMRIESGLIGISQQMTQLREENNFLKKRLEQLSHIKASLMNKNATASSNLKRLIQQLQEENL